MFCRNRLILTFFKSHRLSRIRLLFNDLFIKRISSIILWVRHRKKGFLADVFPVHFSDDGAPHIDHDPVGDAHHFRQAAGRKNDGFPFFRQSVHDL